MPYIACGQDYWMAISNGSDFGLLLPSNNTHGDAQSPMVPSVHGDIVQGALLVTIAILGAALNLFLVLAILPNPRMRSVRQVLLVHLGLVGLLTSLLLTLPAGVLQMLAALNMLRRNQEDATRHLSGSYGVGPFETAHDHVVGATRGLWEAGALCTFIGWSGVLLTSCTVWTVAALAWDKHRAIAAPLHHPLAARRLTMTIWLTSLWTVSGLLATPPLFGGGDLCFVTALWRCGVHAGSSRGRWHGLVFVLVGVVTPLSIMLYCYTHIFRIARVQSSRIAATMLRMVTLIQAPIAPPPARAAGMMRLRGTRAMATIIQLVGSCVASYVPWAVLLLVEAATDVPPTGLPAATAAILLHAAPLTAATVYGLRNRNLRASFVRFANRRMQQCCRLHRRRRPSLKSLTRNSSSFFTRKVQNGSAPLGAGMRRTFSLQTSRRPGEHISRDDALLPRPHSYNVLAPDRTREQREIGETTT